MNKKAIAYLRCIRSFLFVLWFIVLLFFYENRNNKDKLA